MSGEDLTAQAGIAVQQDLALTGLLGFAHVERNGHHYVDGFAGQHAPPRERMAFANAHPDLYETMGDNVRLRIRDGRIGFRSLDAARFGVSIAPALDAMSRMSLRPSVIAGA